MEKKVRLTLALVFLAFAGMFITSCYPTDNVNYEDLDLVATVYDKSENFEALSSFALPDTIVHLKDTTNPDNDVDLSRQYDSFILNLIRENMVNYGYEFIENPDTSNRPDVVLTVSAMGTKNYRYGTGIPITGTGIHGIPGTVNQAKMPTGTGIPAIPGIRAAVMLPPIRWEH
jgi:hypothetical protein